MKITVKLIGFLQYTGLPGGFTGGVVDISDRSSTTDLLTAIGLYSPTQYLLVRDGRLIESEEILEDGDVIEIIPPIGGGVGL